MADGGADAWTPPTAPTVQVGGLEVLLDADAQVIVGIAGVDAIRRGHASVDAFHLLFALTCAPAAAAWLRSHGADPRSIGGQVDEILGVAERTDPPAQVRWTHSTVRVLVGARRRGDTVGLIEACASPSWWARLVRRSDAQTWLFSRLGGPPLAQPRPQVAPPGSAAVVLHNDGKTTMEFVIDALESKLGRSRWHALSTMLEVNERGSAVAAVLPVDEARKRADEVVAAARSRGFPLTVTVEPG